MITQRTPVTAEKACFTFYDIESLPDVFTLCAYTPQSGSVVDTLEIFFLADDQQLSDAVDPQALYEAVVRSNPGLPAVSVQLWNLRGERGNLRLAEMMGLSNADQVNDRGEVSSYPASLRPVCDTDPDYDPVAHPFLAGYNSLNYDTVMLALYLMEAFPAPHSGRLIQPTTAREMREHNDKLFNEHIEYMPGYLGWDGPASKIRRAMLHSGRHLDVARLNELQVKVGLKRLLGMLGHQIKESEKLSHDTSISTIGELYELLAYNVSDCLGLAQLFQHPAYASAFDLKAGLLTQYSETVYAKNGSVRRDRLTIDSSSAKFVGRILAPYTALNDIESVSFLYPAKAVADERGISQVNILDECVRFFEENVAPDPGKDAAATPAQAKAHQQFMRVVDYYRSIEGQNFNDSEEYRDLFDLPAKSLRELPKAPNNVPYFHRDASPSSCFVTFSTGGIHGAEADMTVFDADSFEHREQAAAIGIARLFYPDAKDFVAEAKRQHNLLALPDGTAVDKRLVLLGSDPEKAKYRKPKKGDPDQAEQLARAQAQVPDPAELLATQRPDAEALHVRLADGTVLDGKVVLAVTSAVKAAYRDEPAKKAPTLFTVKADRSTKLHPKFARTSAGLVIHEDFTSYYPNLLRNMKAFYNPELGEDRYTTIFFEKERLGFEMKKPGISSEEKARLTTLRNGTKLILNSASGAADAAHRTPIRMNNRTIAMRIIGQLFSWRIGQAQTLAGARIISTNTDGLYSVVGGENGFDETTNNRVLAEQQAAIGIDIEPELMFLISKDSNNRLELEPPGESRSVADSPIITASGGTLACHAGPTPTKSLAHPAVIDFALARYLQTVASRGEEALAEPFDPVLGRKMIEEAVDPADPVRTLLLFQNVLAASRGKVTYPFAADPVGAGPDGDDNEDSGAKLANPRALQMVNRVFIVRDGTDGAVSLHNAGAWKVTPASQSKRRESGIAGVRRDPVALEILRHHGWAKNRNEASTSDGLRLLPDDQDVVIRRINGIDPSWSMVVVNDDLRTLPASRAGQLIGALALGTYTWMLDETFTRNWRNAG
ncbi:hypothetical protein [Streptomyces sp. NBC_01768]|uniref:hypothetical protein n=1 Tax=Streptomyces sp. NBC_01768 TaxID=2975938 RepID=UPI002DD9ACD6|nr:hypothetical protein [Streptomyces sp. NBC_01768]WSC32281.1 hypothetical protein OG902_39480 [Streptomyces sp. NBC_01768]